MTSISTGMSSEESIKVLELMKSDRGYLLSFHQFLAQTNLDYLRAYAEYYKQATLENKHLDEHTKELVWIGILSMVGDAVGSIHVERAIKVGIDEAMRESVIKLASRAAIWPYLEKTSTNWGRFQMPDAIVAYQQIITDNKDYEQLGKSAELIMLNVSGVLRNDEPFLHHLNKCLEIGFSEAQIIESLTFLVNPLGFNRLQWACDLWLKGIAAGLVPSSSLFTDGLPDARIK